MVWVVSDSQNNILGVFDNSEGTVNFLISCIKEAKMPDEEKWRTFINFYDLAQFTDDDFAVNLSNDYIVYAKKYEVEKSRYTLS